MDAPSAIDYFLGALASDLTVGFKAQASRRNIEIDQMEVSLKAGLENVFFIWNWKMKEVQEFKTIKGTFYVSFTYSQKTDPYEKPDGKYA